MGATRARQRALKAAFALSLLCATPTVRAQMASLDDLDREFVDLVERCAPAVVRVEPGLSGVCIDPAGLVLTDATVAAKRSRRRGGRSQPDGSIRVVFSDGLERSAEVLCSDADTRVALLRIRKRGRYPAAEIGDPGELRPGHFLLTIGNAFGTASQGAPTATLGVVSSLERDAQGSLVGIETSAATNPGQNGAPYFDLDGRLVGMAQALPEEDRLARLVPVTVVELALRARCPQEDLAFRPPPRRTPRRTKGHVLQAVFARAAEDAARALCVVRPLLTGDDGEAETADAQGRESTGREGGDRRLMRRTTTGLVVREDGWIVASLRMFPEGVDRAECRFRDGRVLEAYVIARDAKAGLAFLHGEPPGEGAPLPRLPAVPADAIAPGRFAVAVGLPDDPSSVFVTVGIVSGTGRLNAYVDALATDAGIGPRNAGGALVDISGRLFGVILPAPPKFGDYSGLGLCMPAARLYEILPKRMAGEDTAPPRLGAQLAPDPEGGVRIVSVEKDGPLERAGLAGGDRIVGIDGVEVHKVRDLVDHLYLRNDPGDTVVLTVHRRDGGLVEKTVRLASR